MIQLNSYIQLQKVYQYLRSQKEKEKFFNYIEIAATFVLISFLLIFAIKPTASAISSLLGEIKSKEVLSQKMRLKINSVVAAQEVYSEVQEKYNLIDSSLPDLPHFYQAAANFSSLASQLNLSSNKVDFILSDESKSVDIVSYGVSFSSKSNYQSILDYISRIQKVRRLVDFQKIQILKNVDLKDGPSSDLDLTIDSKLFYLKN